MDGQPEELGAAQGSLAVVAVGGCGGLPPKWLPGEAEVVADCRIFKVNRRPFRHPTDGRAGAFFVIDTADWVLVLGLTPVGRLILVNQYRYGVDELSWEPPGGVVDAADGADLVAAGLREFREETGYQVARARYLGWVHPNPAIMNNRAHFILATGCVVGGLQELDANEEIAVGEFSLEEALEMAATGQIHHCVAHAALLSLKRAWPEVRAEEGF